MTAKPVLAAITGASGAIYARLLLKALLEDWQGDVLLVVSDAGKRLLREEEGVEYSSDSTDFTGAMGLDASLANRLRIISNNEIGAGPASGSFPLHGMAIVPCSMRTLAAVANGLADNLICRAADVCLKEHRRLVMAPRETPLNAIHLENMLKLAQTGARIVPPSPAFYFHPQSLEDAALFIIQKILEQLDIPVTNPRRWEPR
ncbi:MAG: UbiX family flavin prenyltransferase [Candidatus Sumerlaeia bacterium]